MKLRGIGLCVLVVSALQGCPGDDDEDLDSTTMCYSSDGTTLTIKCYTTSLHSCEEDGMSSLGSYDTSDLCWDDVDAVLQNWEQNHEIALGPTANESGGGSSGGGGSSSSGGSGGSYDWSFTCPDTGTSSTLPIPKGSCESEYKQYGQTFGCNQVDSFYSACYSLYSCLVRNEGSGYQQNLDYCASYQQ